MELIAVLTLLKGLSPFSLVVSISILTLAVSQGWIVIQGLKLKKKSLEVPTACLSGGRAGACELIRLQMEMAETKMNSIKSIALSEFMRMKIAKTGEAVTIATDRDYHGYRAAMFEVGCTWKSLMLEMFRKNHLASKTELEFELYIKDRVNQTSLSVAEMLDQLYYAGSDPSRQELAKHHSERFVPAFHKAIEDCLREARQLAIKFADGKLEDYMEKR